VINKIEFSIYTYDKYIENEDIINAKLDEDYTLLKEK
jgi:hypothetical protein